MIELAAFIFCLPYIIVTALVVFVAIALIVCAPFALMGNSFDTGEMISLRKPRTGLNRLDYVTLAFVGLMVIGYLASFIH